MIRSSALPSFFSKKTSLNFFTADSSSSGMTSNAPVICFLAGIPTHCIRPTQCPLTSFRMDGHIVNGENGVVESSVVVEMLTKLDVDLAYSSEKMVNLDLFMATVSLGESELEDLSVGNNNISEEETEKGLILDLCFGYLDSEVAELDHFLAVLSTKIYDAKQKMYLCRQRSESLQRKLDVLEGSWKHLQEQVLEMKRQLANLRRTLSIIGPGSACSSDHEELELQEVEQQRSVLRMLEKSLASELDFEKQLLESKQREEVLKSKLSRAKRFLSDADAFSEAALAKLLETECSSEVFLGIAKEMMSRLQVLNFHLHCSIRREDELKLKLECKNEAMSKMEALSEDALGRLIEAEHSSDIFMSVIREMSLLLRELNSKLSCTSEVASEMEAYSEVALERALEAEHCSVIFSAIVKEMMSRIQLLEHDLHGSVQKEQDVKSRLFLTNESISNLEAYLEDALERLLEAELSDEILIGIVEQMLSYLKLLQSDLHSSVQREQELNSQLLLTSDIVSNLEAFSELALEKLLDAEHRAEIFTGIAKEMVSRIQILQFNLQCAVQREGDLSSKLQGSLKQLKEKETALMKAENNYAEMKQTLQEKETLMEEKLRVSESKLQETKALYEASQEQVSLMEDAVQSLREHVFMAESRAHESEAKLTALAEENIELRDEVEFLKGGNSDSSEGRISKLEEQVSDLETQLQTAKMSSEASQEQQNMLYTAIWDMETLIEELKSKVSKAENRAECSEEQYLVLAETNLGLSEEIRWLKDENEKLKGSLKEANRKNVAREKEINSGTKLITEMVMQLAVERKRIQKQLSCLARENKKLMEELQKTRQNGVKPKQDNKLEHDEKESSCVMDDRAMGVSASEQLGETPTSTTNQEEELSEQKMRDDVQPGASYSSDLATTSDNILTHDNEGRSRKGRSSNMMSYIFATLLVLVLSILATSIN